MPLDCILKTHHSVEYVRKRRRVVERGAFSLDVPVRIATASAEDMPVAFSRLAARDRPALALRGHDGGLWRAAVDGDRLEATLVKGSLRIGASIAPAMAPPLRKTKEGPLVPFAVPDVRIVSDDREARVAAALDAARTVMMVDGKVWVRAREPEWMVRKKGAAGDVEIVLLSDVHSDWRDYIVKDHMRFRLDRLPQAMAWARLLRGAGSTRVEDRTPAETAAEIVAGEWDVTAIDLDFFRQDDLLEYARGHLRRTIEACASVIDAVPTALRRRWEELRIVHDNIHGAGAREAALAGLALVPGTLDMLTGVRDISADRRAGLLRRIVRLRQTDRRTTMIEGIAGEAPSAEIDAADLEALAP